MKVLAADAVLVAVVIGVVRASRHRPGTPPPPVDPVTVPGAAPLHGVALRLRPLHRPMDPPEPGDWLLEHRETGQSFAQYLAESPVTARGERRVLYVQPLGDFTPTQRRLVEATAAYLGHHYGVPVRTLPDVPLDAVPARARRIDGFTGQPQLLTTWILDEVLPPRLPADGLAVLALSATDLWPGRGWNFVFGQASLSERVGVWSLARNGDPDAGGSGYREALLRTLKTAVHETGHMLSIRHCTAFECGMCGSNSRPESDRRPLAFCPECEAKVWWATGADPVARFEALAAWCRAQGLAPEADHFARSAAALRGPG